MASVLHRFGGMEKTTLSLLALTLTMTGCMQPTTPIVPADASLAQAAIRYRGTAYYTVGEDRWEEPARWSIGKDYVQVPLGAHGCTIDLSGDKMEPWICDENITINYGVRNAGGSVLIAFFDYSCGDTPCKGSVRFTPE